MKEKEKEKVRNKETERDEENEMEKEKEIEMVKEKEKEKEKGKEKEMEKDDLIRDLMTWQPYQREEEKNSFQPTDIFSFLEWFCSPEQRYVLQTIFILRNHTSIILKCFVLFLFFIFISGRFLFFVFFFSIYLFYEFHQSKLK